MYHSRESGFPISGVLKPSPTARASNDTLDGFIMSEMSMFSSSTAFCARCGSILPLLQKFGSVKCYACKAVYDASNYSNLKFEYTINFNAVSVASNREIINLDNPEGPVVERKCPKCGNDRMSYATLQLRSADEGQTVFYTCISCKYKETENS